VIKVPSLNQRVDDIPILTEFFLEKVCGEYGMATKSISDTAVKALQGIDWTGNIRELRNVVERLVILGGEEISEADVNAFVAIK